ncbi:MAG TPA: 50S ribosomal protein L21 [Turneriella sp.]|nr:50S ribosomal protein L21 [Turneriella sp.]
MQAVIQVGSKQYKVAPDTVFFAELTGVEPGKDFNTNQVLSVNNNGQVKIGQPFVSGASVTAKVLEEVKGPKIIGVFYRTKKHNHRRWGHRQKYHKLQVTSIQA